MSLEKQAFMLKNHKLIAIFSCLLLLLLFHSVYSETATQLPVPTRTVLTQKILTLNDAVLLAIRNNPDIRSKRLQRVIDKYALDVARWNFHPQYKLTGTATYKYKARPTYTSNPEISLNTPAGTTLTTTLENQLYTDTAKPTINLKATQPLLRGFGTTIATATLNDALDQEIINQWALKTTLMDTIVSVVKAYHLLVKDYSNLITQKQALARSENDLKNAELKVKHGKLAPKELVQQKSQAASQKVAVITAQNTIDTDLQALLTLLGLNPKANISINKSISIRNLKVPNQEKSIKLALANNVDYQSSIISLKKTKRALLVAKDNQRWKLDLSVEGKVFGKASPIQVQTGEAPPYTQTDQYPTVTLDLDIPVHDLSLKKTLEDATIGLQQAKIDLAEKKRQLVSDVIKAIQDIISQQQQIKEAKQAVYFAQDSLDTAQIKLNYGKTTVFEVTQLQDTLTTDQLNLTTEQIGYLDTLADFEKTLGVTLDKWGITVNY